MLHLYSGILLSNKKERTTDMHSNLDESPGNYAEWKKGKPKGLHTMYVYLYKPLEMTKL